MPSNFEYPGEYPPENEDTDVDLGDLEPKEEKENYIRVAPDDSKVRRLHDYFDLGYGAQTARGLAYKTHINQKEAKRLLEIYGEVVGKKGNKNLYKLKPNIDLTSIPPPPVPEGDNIVPGKEEGWIETILMPKLPGMSEVKTIDPPLPKKRERIATLEKDTEESEDINKVSEDQKSKTNDGTLPGVDWNIYNKEAED